MVYGIGELFFWNPRLEAFVRQMVWRLGSVKGFQRAGQRRKGEVSSETLCLKRGVEIGVWGPSGLVRIRDLLPNR